MIIGKYPSLRLRRSRKESWSRRLIQENTLSPNDFILPIFLIEGSIAPVTTRIIPAAITIIGSMSRILNFWFIKSPLYVNDLGAV